MFKGGRGSGSEAYCTRRCGPSADGEMCPVGFQCYPATSRFRSPFLCYCVDESQLDLTTDMGAWMLERCD